MTKIPESHTGIPYGDFLTIIAQKRSVQRYLEIGVNEGTIISKIPAKIALGVDPNFIINSNVASKKKVTVLVQEPSDVFFASNELRNLLGGPPDFAFLDGMHTFEFLLRDFYNTERFSAKGSLVALHDCLPLAEPMIQRDFRDAFEQSKEGKFSGWWTGDVWKVVLILNKYRPDLRIVCVDCPPTGLVFVTNLNPSSTLLEDRYFEIVDEFRTIKNDIAGISSFYENITLIDSRQIINEFDQSLYFRT